MNFLKKHSFILITSAVSFVLVYLFLLFFNSNGGIEPTKASARPAHLLVSAANKDRIESEITAVGNSSILQELANAAAFEHRQSFDQAESIYKQLLSNEQILEAHDPLRVIVLERYGKLLMRLGRLTESEAMFAESKRVSIRRKIDRHPARAHIS